METYKRESFDRDQERGHMILQYDWEGGKSLNLGWERNAISTFAKQSIRQLTYLRISIKHQTTPKLKYLHGEP